MIICRCDAKTEVKDSRVLESPTLGIYTRRRRECGNCGERSTTYEISAELIEDSLKANILLQKFKALLKDIEL